MKWTGNSRGLCSFATTTLESCHCRCSYFSPANMIQKKEYLTLPKDINFMIFMDTNVYLELHGLFQITVLSMTSDSSLLKSRMLFANNFWPIKCYNTSVKVYWFLIRFCDFHLGRCVSQAHLWQFHPLHESYRAIYVFMLLGATYSVMKLFLSCGYCKSVGFLVKKSMYLSSMG